MGHKHFFSKSCRYIIHSKFTSSGYSAACKFYQSYIRLLQTSQQTQFMYDTYAFGVHALQELTKDEFSALENKLTYIPDSRKFLFYTRMKKRKRGVSLKSLQESKCEKQL